LPHPCGIVGRPTHDLADVVDRTWRKVQFFRWQAKVRHYTVSPDPSATHSIGSITAPNNVPTEIYAHGPAPCRTRECAKVSDLAILPTDRAAIAVRILAHADDCIAVVDCELPPVASKDAERSHGPIDPEESPRRLTTSGQTKSNDVTAFVYGDSDCAVVTRQYAKIDDRSGNRQIDRRTVVVRVGVGEKQVVSDGERQAILTGRDIGRDRDCVTR